MGLTQKLLTSMRLDKEAGLVAEDLLGGWEAQWSRMWAAPAQFSYLLTDGISFLAQILRCQGPGVGSLPAPRNHRKAF